MTTAYTSLLGLALPVTGELAGTWGDIVNNAITSLLDSSIAGTTTLSTDADVTLTSTTGAANQARQAIILCSGARTVQRTITAPAQSKIYLVINNTTGGQSVKIVGTGPTTGVTISNGRASLVVWNGADFVEIGSALASSLANGAAGSVPYQSAASTTTFVPIGTASQVLQVNAGATAPEWVGSTGTGNVARVTSPTFVTPTLGAASATSVALGLGSVGSPSLTFTGDTNTGVWSPASDNVSVSTSGTERMRFDSSGSVFIRATSSLGTAIPKLQLGNRTATEIISLQGPTANGSAIEMFSGTQLSLYVGGGASYNMFNAGDVGISTGAAIPLRFGTNNAERAQIDSAGNLGLGVTPKLWNSQLRAMDFGTYGSVYSSTGTDIGLTNNMFYSVGGVLTYKNNGFSTLYEQINGQHNFKTAASGVANNPITYTTIFTIDANGTAGVGVTPVSSWTDTKALQLGLAAAVYGGTAQLGAYVSSNSYFSSGWKYVTNGYATKYTQNESNSGAHEWFISSNNVGGAGQALSFTQGMVLTAAGRLGVGNAAPANTIDINGTFGRGAPVTKTASFTLAATENWIICNGAASITITLPAASSWTGRELMVKNIAAQTVVSASSNIVPLAGGAAGTAILAATAGKWATLVSDGTNWVIMAAA